MIEMKLVSRPPDEPRDFLNIKMWSDGSMIARTRQSVVEGCWGCEGCCTSAVQHESLVDGAESVNFMIGALETGLQLAFDSFEVLDVAGG